ncbi:hypothetical protein VSS37_06920 [Candidatus Thiothrix sp. Deng01]|uniref:Uncharacterized protein n=1 Tax=Candidatus Thiothrix phosphatis TaxID=3112415 RepID=A0ABU6CV82_9GAMM|nr:hypothetical protein [Candidatus Thiothrix sp. Deng01]MEB4590705.1 hypothetical protein [Candidatus Thiothrix sp. Deng01]
MKHWRHLLFPSKPRSYPGDRWVNITLRSFHLLGIAGIGGGFLFALPKAQYLPFWHLAIGSGVAMALLYIWENGRWLLQVKGIAVMCKLLLLLLAGLAPQWRAELFAAVILISGVVAHAPGKVRGYSPLLKQPPP